MKPPARVTAFGWNGLPPKTVTIKVEDGPEIIMPVPKSCLLPDGSLNLDMVPALLIQAAARAGYEKLIFELL